MRLELRKKKADATMVLYFNSIKVRLELGILNENRQVTVFQFHKGAIRTMLGFYLIGTNLYFNSIKVRLELKKEFPNEVCSVTFQFHKGAIRTYVL